MSHFHPTPSQDTTSDTEDHAPALPKWAQGAATSGIPRNLKMEQMEALTMRVQDQICAAMERADGEGRFREDTWSRKEGGGGRSRVLQDGRVFEKAGVGVSIVHGHLPPAAVRMMNSRGKNLPVPGAPKPGSAPGAPALKVPFYACGVSLVIHPKNPMAPTAHANYRMFQVLETDPATG